MSFFFLIPYRSESRMCVCVVLAGISDDMTSVKRLMLYMLLNQLPLKEIVKFFKISIIKPPRGFYENNRKRCHIFPNSVLLVLSSFPYCFFFKEHISKGGRFRTLHQGCPFPLKCILNNSFPELLLKYLFYLSKVFIISKAIILQ